VTCAEARELIEAVAAGDDPGGAEFEAHMAGCAGCAADLETARRIERALAAFPVPAAPAPFSRDVMAAVRRARWQHDSRIDRAFNVSIAVGVVIVAVAAVSLLNLGGVATMMLAVLEAMADARREPVPWGRDGSVPVALATTMFAIAFGVWWWAERRSASSEGTTQ